MKQTIHSPTEMNTSKAAQTRREARTNRTLVTISASDDFLTFRTFSRNRRSPHGFCMTRRALETLEETGKFIEKDCVSFAEGFLIQNRTAVEITFHWIHTHGDGTFDGNSTAVILPWTPLRDWMERSRTGDGPDIWKCLSLERRNSPHFVFERSRSLRQALGNRLVRRKLVKFLRDNFQWYDAVEIRFSGDWDAYSFFFREILTGGGTGISGGLILHNRENLKDAYYFIHT